jgi:hypothetical protein
MYCWNGTASVSTTAQTAIASTAARDVRPVRRERCADDCADRGCPVLRVRRCTAGRRSRPTRGAALLRRWAGGRWRGSRMRLGLIRYFGWSGLL